MLERKCTFQWGDPEFGSQADQIQALQPLSRPHFSHCSWHSEMLPGLLSWHHMCPLEDWDGGVRGHAL